MYNQGYATRQQSISSFEYPRRMYISLVCLVRCSSYCAFLFLFFFLFLSSPFVDCVLDRRRNKEIRILLCLPQNRLLRALLLKSEWSQKYLSNFTPYIPTAIFKRVQRARLVCGVERTKGMANKRLISSRMDAVERRDKMTCVTTSRLILYIRKILFVLYWFLFALFLSYI